MVLYLTLWIGSGWSHIPHSANSWPVPVVECLDALKCHQRGMHYFKPLAMESSYCRIVRQRKEVCTCVCVCMYAYDVCAYVSVHVCAHVYMYICVCLHVYMCVDVHVYTCVVVDACMCICVYMCAYTYVGVHMLVCVHRSEDNLRY